MNSDVIDMPSSSAGQSLKKFFGTVGAPEIERSSVTPKPDKHHEPLLATSAAQAPARVLVVEDMIEIAAYVQRALQANGFEVWVANTGFHAYEILARQAFDLVLLDVDLPDANGFDICKWIRGQELMKQLRVVFCTGRDEPETRRDANQLGAGFLAKPFSMASLLEHTKAALALNPSKPDSSAHGPG
jgi:CheY-like chemotaxis protein